MPIPVSRTPNLTDSTDGQTTLSHPFGYMLARVGVLKESEAGFGVFKETKKTSLKAIHDRDRVDGMPNIYDWKDYPLNESYLAVESLRTMAPQQDSERLRADNNVITVEIDDHTLTAEMVYFDPLTTEKAEKNLHLINTVHSRAIALHREHDTASVEKAISTPDKSTSSSDSELRLDDSALSSASTYNGSPSPDTPTLSPQSPNDQCLLTLDGQATWLSRSDIAKKGKELSSTHRFERTENHDGTYSYTLVRKDQCTAAASSAPKNTTPSIKPPSPALQEMIWFKDENGTLSKTNKQDVLKMSFNKNKTLQMKQENVPTTNGKLEPVVVWSFIN